ncbi:MAG: amidase family protein, partial [Pseudomonadota bacterium]
AFHRAAYRKDSSKLGPGLRALVESGQMLPAVDYVQAQRVRRKLCQEALAAMAPYDALLLPTTPLPACPVVEDDPSLVAERFRNCLLFDVLSVPAISVPCGFDADEMPVGLQIVGKAFAEDHLLALARFFERETHWHRQRPSM